MRLSAFALLASLAAVMAAPSAEANKLEARAPSCNIINDGCYISCRQGTRDCSSSYCKASGTAGPYGYCICLCR